MVLSCLSPAARMSSYTTSSPASTFHSYSFFFFNDPATTEIYTLSLHDALPLMEHIQSQRAVLETASANHNVVACLAADSLAFGFQFERHGKFAAIGRFQFAFPRAVKRVTSRRPARGKGEEDGPGFAARRRVA